VKSVREGSGVIIPSPPLNDAFDLENAGAKEISS
jgi:hypothetical protein